jgi:sugar lactone lactonase YvrE
MAEVQTLMTGLVMGESPRWHDDRLWLSDMGAGEVIAVDPKGRSEVVARVPSGLAGIGFLPDGQLLIVANRDGLLLRLEPDGSLMKHADLTGVFRPPWSDLVVDGRGNAYVSNVGFDFPGGEYAAGIVALVTTDGSARPVADGFSVANGLAVTPDNSTLIVAESYGSRLTAFDIGADGSLSKRRVWADLQGDHPDGICIDAEGAVWYADVPAKHCVRVREGGEVRETIDLDLGCFACVLGGTDGRTLFVTAAEWPLPQMTGSDRRTGQVVTLRAPAPAAGWP